jgi:hypothetical protein
MDEQAAAEPTEFRGTSGRLVYGTVSDKSLGSKRKKEKNALAHFSLYLKIKRGMETPIKDLPPDQIDHDLMGGFLKYLAEDARRYLKEDGDRISMGSATGYASAVKVYLCNLHRDRTPPPTLAKENWSSLLREMSSMLVQRHRKEGTQMVKPHDSSTAEDRKGMALLCVWKGDITSAEFLFLDSCMYHCAGRGSECAGTRTQHLSVEMTHEPFMDYPMLKHWMPRHKNSKVQVLDIACHRVSCSTVNFSTLHKGIAVPFPPYVRCSKVHYVLRCGCNIDPYKHFDCLLYRTAGCLTIAFVYNII